MTLQAPLSTTMSIQGTASVLRSSSFLSLTKPFTPNSLKTLRLALSVVQQSDQSPSPLQQSHESKSRNAGVLIPLCNVEGKPGILFQVRAKNLRNHSGEVR